MLAEGVIAAVATPLLDNGLIDCDVLFHHCSRLIHNGCDGVALLGTTGEGNSFSLSERLDLLEKVSHWNFESSQLMIGTGCCAIPDTVALTKEALAAGCGGILMLPPFFYKSVTDTGILRYFDRVINEVGNSKLNIYLYHIPQYSGISYTLGLMQKLILAFPDHIKGYKDSSGDLDGMIEKIKVFPQLHFYVGTEAYLLKILQYGGSGCISTTANLTSPNAQEIYQSWKRNDDPTQLQELLFDFVQAFGKFPPVGALKSCLQALHRNEHWERVRPPNTELIADDVTSLLCQLEELNHIDIAET